MTDGRTDGQNYDSQDRTSIAASRGKNNNEMSNSIGGTVPTLYSFTMAGVIDLTVRIGAQWTPIVNWIRSIVTNH